MKILVAEDDEVLREEIADVLRSGGHQVEMARDGAEAIRLLEGQAFDLALVDWNMPGKSGGELVRKAREVRPLTAVIVMTGYGSVDTAVEALKSGAKDFLRKPFEIDALERTIQTIREELAARPRRAPPAAAPSRAAEMKAAFLHSKDGLLIAAKVRSGEKTGDEDLLVATLNVIQNFMRISFPILKGKQLRAISQGDHTLVTEAGKHAFLTVVIRGPESRGIRERMRSAIRAFEDENKEALARRSAFMEEMKGADTALSRLLTESS